MHKILTTLSILVVTNLVSTTFTFANLEQKDSLAIAPSPASSQNITSSYPSFADVVEPLMPAVVSVYTTKYNKTVNRHKNPFPEGFPFENFSQLFEQFNMPFSYEEPYSNPKATFLGSGFIIDPAGYIVTNHHVVRNADEIHIKLLNNTELGAKLIGSDSRTDLALLKVEVKEPLPFVKFGDSNKIRVGDPVITIGNPFGFGGTVTSGIISSKGRDLDLESGGIVDNFIQTDAAINSGNSGGPMFNLNGEVIGVNTAIVSPVGVNIGIGFAIPSDTTRSVVEQLRKTGKISRGRLGISIQEMTNEISEGLNLKGTTGALVGGVIPGGAGDKAGIKPGDLIIEFGGREVKNHRKLEVLVAESPVGKEAKIKIIRAGKNIELVCKIIENEPDTDNKELNDLKSNDHIDQQQVGLLKKNGIIYNNLTEELRRKYQLKDQIGIVITSIDKETYNNRLKVGDLVVSANWEPTASIEQFNKIYQNAKGAKKKNIVLFVKRQEVSFFVSVPLD
ncbi:MAG: Do family serine endopeptidase [Rickettsiaceae bacterium]|nr:MAG: Do family serine endopeptidase [Rickettsiaceae bacterium]